MMSDTSAYLSARWLLPSWKCWVAEAIFLILLLIVMQVIFGALQTTTAQKKRMDELGDRAAIARPT